MTPGLLDAELANLVNNIDNIPQGRPTTSNISLTSSNFLPLPFQTTSEGAFFSFLPKMSVVHQSKWKDDALSFHIQMRIYIASSKCEVVVSVVHTLVNLNDVIGGLSYLIQISLSADSESRLHSVWKSSELNRENSVPRNSCAKVGGSLNVRKFLFFYDLGCRTLRRCG